PYFLAVDVDAPGMSAAQIQQQITDPIGAYLREHAPFIKREIPVEVSDGRAHMQIVLNPDYSFSFFHSQWIQMTTDYNPENIEDQLDYSHEQLLELLEDAKAELETGDRIHSMSTEFTRRPAGIAIHDINDVSFFVKRRLRVLGSNGIMGLILVIASLFFFMGWRTSTMVAAGIPVALGISFVVMNFLGVTLNLISMFGLIMVIGIIVDDAIIVSENFYRYLEEGLPTLEAAARGTAEVIPPVVATISTSVAAFGPMMFMSGIFGKFVYTIPLVVIIALLASLFECFFILPSHLYEMNELGGVKADIKEGGNWFTFLRDQLYMPALEFGLRHRWVGVGGLVAMFIATLLIFGAFGEFKLFPSAIETLHVKITLPSGRTKEQTSRYIHAIEHHLNQLSDDELKNYTARAGITQKPGGNDPFTRRGSNYGQLVVFLTSELDRPDVPTELIATRLRSQTEWLLDDTAYINKKERDLALIERMEEKGGDEADAIRSVYMNESTDALRDEWRRLRELREEEAQYSSAALEDASNGTRDSEAVNQPAADSTTEDGVFASIGNWFNGDEEERTLAEISAEKRRLREQFNRDLLA
ncbi:MAG: efflux RND transporter permease subunit, partial [Leptospiraceae bacterium]|nr:efflux RND transporter permease subunit [Leptospiraceae bacterium]